MKYRDLIEALLPVADEEVNMETFSEKQYYSMYDDDPEFGDKKKIISKVKFYHSKDDNNDLIVTVKQVYDEETYENIEEPKVTKAI